jgi:hypothetical protein
VQAVQVQVLVITITLVALRLLVHTQQPPVEMVFMEALVQTITGLMVQICWRLEMLMLMPEPLALLVALAHILPIFRGVIQF